MPILLVTNHKGGVGKTFVAVHLAKSLSDHPTKGGRVLLVDCDGQYDAYRFYARSKPNGDGVPHVVNERLTLFPNQACKSLRGIGFEEINFDYIVIDSDARLADTAKNIVQNAISLILAPVNFQSLSIENLDDLVLTVGKVFGINAPFQGTGQSSSAPGGAEEDARLAKLRSLAKVVAEHIFIVPLAADDAALAERLKTYRVKTKVKIGKNMPSMPAETNESLARGILLWELPALSDEQKTEAKAYFTDLAERVIQSCGP